jgi:hypothetical protein
MRRWPGTSQTFLQLSFKDSNMEKCPDWPARCPPRWSEEEDNQLITGTRTNSQWSPRLNPSQIQMRIGQFAPFVDCTISFRSSLSVEVSLVART